MKKCLFTILLLVMLFCVACTVNDGIDTSTDNDIYAPLPTVGDISEPESEPQTSDEKRPVESYEESTSSAAASETIVPEDPIEDFNIFLYGMSDSGVFDETTARIHEGNYYENIDFNGPAQKSYVYNGDHMLLNYEEAYKNPYGKYLDYRSSDGNMRFRFDMDTGRLLQVADYSFDISTVSADEEENKKIIEEYVRKITGDDLSKYIYSCETSYSNEITSNIHVPYFYVPTAPEEYVLSYHFSYDLYIDGIDTTDGVSVLMGSYMSIIKFNNNDFKDVTHVDFEYDEVSMAVDSFCSSYIDTDQYVFVDSNISKAYLTFVENKMYLCCQTRIDYWFKGVAYDEPFSVLELIYVEI